jgi:hypothetical protein
MMPFLWLVIGATTPAPLPLARVTLYENGVGYFERAGELAVGGEATLPVGPGQLDDALKTLVVLSSGGVASIEYTPPVSPEAARTSAGIPDENTHTSLYALVRALKGVEVDVRLSDGGVHLGRVVEISEDEKQLDDKGAEHAVPMLLLFGAQGLTKLAVRTVQSVRPTEVGIGSAWQRALAAMAERQSADALKIRSSRRGGRVSVGYTTEAPVWRTTYRLVIRDGNARLQGFGLVHNDSDETWRDVDVTLASGRPTSFIVPLAGPRYERREVLATEDGLEAAPQLVQPEVRDALRGGETTGGSIGFGVIGHGRGGGGSGSGSGVGTLGGRFASPNDPSVSDVGPTPLEPAAVSEAGNIFLYHVFEPVTLGPKQSALLPIVDSSISAEQVTMIDLNGNATSSARLLNSTALTLEQGTMSVFVDGHYAGETRIDRVKPKEVRVVAHGQDLDVVVVRSMETQAGPANAARVEGGALRIKFVEKTVHHLDIRSSSKRPRTLLVELKRSARLTSADEEDERSPEQPRYARLKLPPRGILVRKLVEENGAQRSTQAAALTSEAFDAVLKSPLLPRADAAKLKPLRSVVVDLETVKRTQTQVDERLALALAEVNRLRESAGALPKTAIADAARALGSRLADREAEIAQLKREQTELREKVAELVKRFQEAP